MRGIDVSSHNGQPFNSVTERGFVESDFVIVKTTQGDWYVNPAADYAIDRARRDGKLIGIYHYAEGKDPVAEADFFVKHWRDEALPVLDWESGSNASWGSTQWCRRFVDRVRERKGVYPVLYTGMEGCRQSANCHPDCKLWFAGYPENADAWGVPRFPYTIPIWGRYDIWQFTSGGGRLDRNVTDWTRDDWIRASGKEQKMAQKGTAARLLEVAQAEVGRSDGTKYGRWYEANVDKNPGNYDFGGRGVPYCAMFASWCADQASVKCAGLPGAYCPTIYNMAKEAGKLVPVKDARPGDVVLFDWDGGVCDHIGIVKANTGSSLRTIEGNTDNGDVGERTQSYGVVAGVIRPDFATPSVSKALHMHTSNGTDAQKFAVEWIDGTWFRLKNKACGLYLDVSGGGKSRGAKLHLHTGNKTDAQAFRAVPVSSSYKPSAPYYIVPKCAPELVLDVKNGKDVDGAAIQTWTKNKTLAQQWAILDMGSSTWTLLSLNGSHRAIDAKGGGK